MKRSAQSSGWQIQQCRDLCTEQRLIRTSVDQEWKFGHDPASTRNGCEHDRPIDTAVGLNPLPRNPHGHSLKWAARDRAECNRSSTRHPPRDEPASPFREPHVPRAQQTIVALRCTRIAPHQHGRWHPGGARATHSYDQKSRECACDLRIRSDHPRCSSRAVDGLMCCLQYGSWFTSPGLTFHYITRPWPFAI